MSGEERWAVWRSEWLLAVSVGTSLIFLLFGDRLWTGLDSFSWRIVVFVWLFATILGSALGVVRHADRLAERLGEPYGTLILTLAITCIEVVAISTVMLHGANNPTLARDTLFAVTMIILNGMIGLSLLLGGWRRMEQHYNLQGANAYLGVIIPLGVLALVLPNYTVTTPGATLHPAQELFLGVMSVGMFLAFLGLQTSRHRGYFSSPSSDEAPVIEHPDSAPPSVPRHALLLVAYMVPVVFLAEHLAVPVDYVVEIIKAPAALAGLTIAILVATPEAIGAIRAASRNQLQRSVNISLGSVLSTIGLTIPAILLVGHFTHHALTLGLQNTSLLLFLLTLALSVVTFASGHTNVLQGAAHLILFAAYLFFIFWP